jgi:hypothetical protein
LTTKRSDRDQKEELRQIPILPPRTEDSLNASETRQPDKLWDVPKRYFSCLFPENQDTRRLLLDMVELFLWFLRCEQHKVFEQSAQETGLSSCARPPQEQKHNALTNLPYSKQVQLSDGNVSPNNPAAIVSVTVKPT